MKNYDPFDWNTIKDKYVWLTPCEESRYYAAKWRGEGRMSLLDLGCGLGRHSLLFAQSGFKVTAVDISDDALSFLKRYSKENGEGSRGRGATAAGFGAAAPIAPQAQQKAHRLLKAQNQEQSPLNL